MVGKTWRTVSTQTYVVAGIITLLIFSLGLLLGLVLESNKYNYIEEINFEQEVSSLSLQLQYLYLTTSHNENSCAALQATLRQAVTDLSSSLSAVIAYEEENAGNTKRTSLVKRRYLLDNIRYWLLSQQAQKQCELNSAQILYFYATECESCPNQGTILSLFKNTFNEQLLVFPLNLDLRHEEPMLNVLISQYNVTKYPTVIIDNKKYEGVIKKEQLKELICDQLTSSEHCSK